MAFPSTDLDVIVEAYLGADPTADPGTWSAPTDLSSRLLRNDIQTRRGRGRGQKTAQAGACTLWLDNTDGALTPLLATSPYYPYWDLGVPFRVSVDNVGNSPPYVRHAGFVADISMVMVPGTNGENISAVRVTSAGVLRRVTQGAVEKSALRRSLPATDPLAYWSLEDGSPVSSLPGGVAMTQRGQVQYQSDVGSVASNALPNFTGGGKLSAPVPSGSVVTEWRLECIARFGTGSDTISDADFTVPVRLDSPNGTVNIWELLISGGTAVFQWSDTSGLYTDLLDSAIAVDDGEWHHIRLEAEQSGGDIAATITVDGVATSSTLVGKTLDSTASRVSINPLSEVADYVGSVGHLAYWAPYASAVDTAEVARAYAGEQAHVRFARICAEEGIPYSGTATTSTECGPQPIADVVYVLQDAEMVDHGMLIEDFAFGLNYRALSQRVNLAPFMTVDLSTYRTTKGTQGDVLAPVRNDARIRNEWTISRPDGATKTASDAASIALRGRFNDSATVNVESDDQIFNEASWRVHEGVFDGLRYDVLPLDLAANE